MRVISIYNNKGGVGKSTLTVGLAEFLAGNRKKKVLVMDLDAQASSSGALLGREELLGAITKGRTIPALTALALESRRVISQPQDYMTVRMPQKSKNVPLAMLDVVPAEKPTMIALEERMNPKKDVTALRDYLKPALAANGYDYVLIDFPGNIDRRNLLPVSAMVMSDFVVVPVEPSQLALGGLPDTFDLVQHACEINSNGRPLILGLVLNKTDKRTEQYRSKFPEILKDASSGKLPPVFDNVIPDAPKLATSTDETREFGDLKDRFDTYYDHVRRVAIELEEMCSRAPEPSPTSARARGFADRFKELFSTFYSKGHKSPSRRVAAKRS